MGKVTAEGHRSGQVTLDASGNGTITLEPGTTWDQWTVTRIVIRTSQPRGTTPVPQADVWLNDPGIQDNHHGGTRDGDLDTATGRIILDAGDQLLIAFTAGRPGDTAFASAWGDYTARTALPGT